MASGWWQPAWKMIDDSLRGLSKGLKAQLRFVRTLRAVLVVGLLLTYASAIVAIVRPQWTQYALASAAVGLSFALIFWYVVVTMPLKAKSIVRLIDQGYPDNARELAIRLAVQKLHDESIRTEELLVETAWNEGKKAYRKYKDRAIALKEELDREAPDGSGNA